MPLPSATTVALIATGSSAGIALLSAIASYMNMRASERIKAEWAGQMADRNARRDYEYEARKRLYEECEPLLFQLVEASENALTHITTAAERARSDKEMSGILYEKTNYYLKALVYQLLLPSAIFRLMQKELTLVDLQLDSSIYLQYMLGKAIYLCFTEDATLAACSTSLEYTPYVKDWREKRAENPQIYRRQGFHMGRLDNALEALIERTDKGNHIIGFGQFEKSLQTVAEDDYNSALGAARDLFLELHPHRRPVLWRILVTQAHLYKCILAVAERARFDLTMTDEDKRNFDWRPDATVDDASVLREPFEAVTSFFQHAHNKKLVKLCDQYNEER